MTSNLETAFTIDRFESGEIDAAQFDHEAHVYVAWLYVQTLGPDEGLERFDAALRRLTKKLGVPEKYDAMLTWLFLKLIAERTRAGENWATFRTRNADLVEAWPRYRGT